jgi:hypothetical protein
MRIAILALAVLAGTGAVEAGQVEVLSASPNRIEVAASCWAGGSYCQQEASDIAQGYCHGRYESSPRRAVPVRSEVVGSGFGTDRVVFVFKCDRRSITCQAGNC